MTRCLPPHPLQPPAASAALFLPSCCSPLPLQLTGSSFFSMSSISSTQTMVSNAASFSSLSSRQAWRGGQGWSVQCGHFPKHTPVPRRMALQLTSTLFSLHSSSPCWHVNSHVPLTFLSCKAPTDLGELRCSGVSIPRHPSRLCFPASRAPAHSHRARG